MIRLTRANGQTLFVNPEHLIEVGYDEDYKQTLVSTLAEGWYITESPEEVARKVLEWRLAMEDYRIFTKRGASDGGYDMANSSRITLESLAGLEEPNND
jgi:uncharacterized protein YlzI (FlbEa/FlbD family)